MNVRLRIALLSILMPAAQMRSAPSDPPMQNGAPAPLYADATPAGSAADLREVRIPNVTIDSVEVDAQDQSCRVTATVTHPPARDKVTVFVALPMRGWNGRFLGTGGSGFSSGNVGNLNGPVAEGFAVGATDGGHQGNTASFALGADGRLNWQAIRDFAYLGIHDMTVVGQALTKAFYGRPARHSYFVGGSEGGRQGLMEAQRFPGDYDGIVANYPAINLQRLPFAELWPQLVMLEEHDFVPKAKLDAATAAAVAACDGADGVADGVIDDPAHCAWDPQALVGAKVGDGEFTSTDADVVRRIWAGPRGYDGKFLWYGLMRGADLNTIAGTEGSPLRGKPARIPVNQLRYFLVQDPQWDWTTLTRGEFELLWNQSVEEYGAVLGTDDPDLTRFRDHGGKLILTHGLADQIIPPEGTISYYQRVEARMGGAARTAEFARLFLVPGANHGFRNAAAAPVGTLNALIAWVEEGQPPRRLHGEWRDSSGKIIRTRPLFPYPAQAEGKGP